MCLKGNRHGKNLCRFFFIKLLTYGAPYDIIITGGEIQMRGESRKKKKSDSKLKAWLAELLRDLIVGIILLILDKLLK